MNNPIPVLAQHSISIRIFNAPTAQNRAPLRLLLMKLDHIGDFITAIDAFRIVRQAFTDADITLICLSAVVALAESTGLFNHVIAFTDQQDKPEFDKFPPVDTQADIDTFTSLLNGPYFLAADFRHDGRSRRWLDHVNADYRAGFGAATRRGLDILLPAMEWDVATATLAQKNLPMHADLRLTLLAHAIVDTLKENLLDAAQFAVPANPVYETLKTNTQFKIGISVGAGAELRKWPIDYWLKLTARLESQRKATFVFFGSAEDKPETQAITARLPPDSYVDLTGAVPLPEIPAYMQLLDSYIGCDTGLTHLAGRLGVPTVNIFAGISNVSVWRARGPKIKTVYADVACAPCHLKFKKDCPNNNVCMTVIVPDIAYACFEQLCPL